MVNILSPEDALISVMIVVSAVDREMSPKELELIGAIVELAPAFDRYDKDRIETVAEAVVDLLQNEDGLDTLLGMARDALPARLRETAYAFACDIAAADGAIALEEIRLLEIIRHNLNIDRLVSAGIERGTRARRQRVDHDA